MSEDNEPEPRCGRPESAGRNRIDGALAAARAATCAADEIADYEAERVAAEVVNNVRSALAEALTCLATAEGELRKSAPQPASTPTSAWILDDRIAPNAEHHAEARQ